MKSFVILTLIGACIHLSSSKEPDKEDKQKYSGPVVYSNLPPPVLYFPNFPEKPEVSRGDEEDKKVEYVPFPYKDLPLLVYQSDNQPPVHVVEKPANEEDAKNTAYSGPAVYQMSDYVQNEQLLEDNKEQFLSDVYPDLGNQQYISIGVSTYHDDSPQQNVVYNVQKTASQPSQAQPKKNGGQQQAMQQQSGGQYAGSQGEMQQMVVGQYETSNAKPQQNGGQQQAMQQQSRGQYVGSQGEMQQMVVGQYETSNSKPQQNRGQQQQQSGGQYAGSQGEMQQMVVGQLETSNAKPQQNGGQYVMQQQQQSSGQYAPQSVSQQSGGQQQQSGGQYASSPAAVPLQYGGQYQVQAAPITQQNGGQYNSAVQQQNGGQYANAMQQQNGGQYGNAMQQQNGGQYANAMQQQNGGQYGNAMQQQNGGQYANAMQQQNGGQYSGSKQQQNGGQYTNVMPQQNGGIYAGPKQQQQNGGKYTNAIQQQNGGQYLTPSAMKQQNIAQYAIAMQQQIQKQQSPSQIQYIPNVIPTQVQQQYIPNQGIIYAPAQSIQNIPPKAPQTVIMQNIAQQYGNQPNQNMAAQIMMNAYQGQQKVVTNLPQQQYQAQMVEMKKEQQPAIVKQAQGMPNLPIIYPTQQNNNYQFPKPSQQVSQPPRNMISPKTMRKNVPQAMPVKEQPDSEAQTLQNGQYVSIGVYPYEGKHDPQQVFTFVIPQDLQKPENDEDSKPLYQDKRRPEMTEQKKPQQPTRYEEPSVEEEPRYQPKDLYMMQQQQQVGKNGNNNRAKPQEPKPQQQQQQYQKKPNRQPQQTTSSSNEEDPQMEYQHILIHIPHSGVPQPQISVVQGSEENQKIRYSEASQRTPEEQIQKNYPDEGEYPRTFKGTPADLEQDSGYQEMPKYPIESYSGSESKLYPQRNPIPRRRPHFNGQDFKRYGQGRSTLPRQRGVGMDEYVAEPSFHVPRVLTPGVLESSNITDFKFLDDPESEVYYEDAEGLHGYRGQNLVDDTAAKLFASQAVPYGHNEFQGFSKVKTGHTAMEFMSVPPSLPVPFPMHPPVSFRPQPVVPYLPYNYQSGQRFLPTHPAYNANRPKGSQKYGGFFRKLAASLLGVRHPISNREGTRDGELPIPTSAVIRTDSRGLDGIPIPLTPTRRMSSAPSRMPPIIVYKGKQPPIEVYGSKDDIETMKAEKRSDEDDEVLDAVLSELANEDEFSERSDDDDEDPLVVLESPQESNTTDTSSPLDADSWSAAFKEDLEELVSLLPKEEKSDLLSP